MFNAPLVVVTPTKNRRALLERALESVLSQRYERYRVIVVNDGSTDDTREYLDSLRNARIQVIHHQQSKGMTATRNAAFRDLKEGEWAVLLDDDDALVPGAFETMARAIRHAPSSIEMFCFCTIITTAAGEFLGGRDFGTQEPYHDLTYREVMYRTGRRGDSQRVLKWSLFPRYLFSENFHALESEWFMRLARDGIGIRYIPEVTMRIDRAHEGEHVSASAIRRDPATFARAYLRVFHDHRRFFADHPDLAMSSARASFKIALRAFDLACASFFAFYYLRAGLRLLFGKGVEDEPKR